MAYDLIVRGGTVVDGTGKPRFAGDVAVEGGRIVAIGEVEGEADRVIDATGLVVAPGFIDCHTHYDAQLFWDPAIDPATWHGITTVLIGNCGFTLAPVRRDDTDYVHGLFSATEEVPKDVLVEHAPLTWETFPEYLDVLDKTDLGVNVLTQFGHSAVRRYVMGEDSISREATEAEVAEMVRLAEEGMEAGAYGVSTSFSPHHIDYSGGHVPSYFSADDEMVALAASVGRKGRKIVALNPKSKREGISQEDKALMTRLAEASGATVSWNDFGTGAADWLNTIEFMEGEIKAGRDVRVVARCQPAETRFQIGKMSPLYSGSKDWQEFCKLDRDAQRAALDDPKWRDRLAVYWKGVRFLHAASVEKVDNPALEPLLGQYIVDMAAERGVDPIGLMFDIARDDNLETFFLMRGRGSEESDRIAERILTSPATMVGISDGGAHLSTFAGADFPTYFLKRWVREKGTFTLEDGVKALSADVADFMGLEDRGTIEVGRAGDLVIFDPDTVQPEQLETLEFPGGATTRLAKRARAIPYVIVNGVPIVEHGERTGAAPGVLLRA